MAARAVHIYLGKADLCGGRHLTPSGSCRIKGQAVGADRRPQRLAGRRSRPRPVPPVWSGPDDHRWPGSPGPPHAAPPILPGRQVIGVGLHKQLFEHRVHDVPPQVGKPWAGPGSGTHGAVAEKSPRTRMRYGNRKQAQHGAGAIPLQVDATGPSGTFWRRLRRQVEAARAGTVPVPAARPVWLMFRPRLATQPVQPQTRPDRPWGRGRGTARITRLASS